MVLEHLALLAELCPQSRFIAPVPGVQLAIINHLVVLVIDLSPHSVVLVHLVVELVLLRQPARATPDDALSREKGSLYWPCLGHVLT